MANEDRAYLAWVRSRPCAMCESDVDVCAHHHTNGTTSPVFPEAGVPLGSNEHARGLGQKAHDAWALPLCAACHIPGIHALGGRFKGWTNQQRRDWQDAQVRTLRSIYLDTEAF